MTNVAGEVSLYSEKTAETGSHMVTTRAGRRSFHAVGFAFNTANFTQPV